MMLLAEAKYPSLQEINFELTELLISSPVASRNFVAPSRAQLQYTLSQISIERELEDQVPSFNEGLPFSSFKDKENGYTTASTRHTLASVKTTFPTMKMRAQSCRQRTSLPKIRASVAVCPIIFQDQPANLMPNVRKRNIQENFRLRKSVSSRERRNSENLPLVVNKMLIEHLQMYSSKEKITKKAFKVKSINLKQNEARGKIYMKKIIQNRASILHLSQTCQQIPWDSKRNTFRM